MPVRQRRNVPTQTPPLQRPHQPDLYGIIKDLQRRISKLESRLNTH